MSFKDISYLGLWWTLCSAEWNHLCKISGRHHGEQFRKIIFKFGPVVQEKILFKDLSHLELWQPFRSTEWNHLCNFGRGYYEEQFCETILNLVQWFSCRLKHLSRALAALLFSGAEPFMQFWKRASWGNIHVKLFEIWTSGSGDV